MFRFSFYSPNSTLMATWIPVAVAAIDFGSAFSGWAMSFRHDLEKEPSKVFTKHWNSGQQITPKTPLPS